MEYRGLGGHCGGGDGDYGSQHSIFYVADYRDWFGRDFSFLIELFNKCEQSRRQFLGRKSPIIVF
jgi:hypothetical protein